MRFRSLLGIICLPFLLGVADGSGQVPTPAQQRCIVALNRAGAGVAAAAARNVATCITQAAHARFSGGRTADECLAGDPGGRLARARARTNALAGKACRAPTDFGPTVASVNAAFTDVVPTVSVFGQSVQAAVVGAKSSRRGTACQQSAARSMGDITQTILREFNDCKAAGLKAGTVRSAEDLGTCWGVDRGGTVARTIGKARGLVTRKCATTPILIAFPGACANEALGTLVDCLVSQLQCALCVGLSAADAAPDLCSASERLRCTGTPLSTTTTSSAPQSTSTTSSTVTTTTTLPAVQPSVARQWDEELLDAIRRDNPRPPVHARNLFHVSVAVYDAWAAYDATAKPYLTHEHVTSTDVERDRAIAISFAAYRVLSERYSPALAIGAAASQASFDARMSALGLDKTDTDTSGPGPAALGNRVAAAVIAFGKRDGSNEDGNYADPTYNPVNQPLIVKTPDIDFTTVTDPNRWQPLALDRIIGQNGVPLPGKIQTPVGLRWGNVTPFALTRANPTDLYLDPGPPPLLTGVNDATDLTFKAQVQQVIELSSRLTPDDPTMIDVSPASYGNNPLGTNDGHGYPVNPVTGQPYTPQLVKRGDFGRLIAEYWADGPTSETPPGHWNVIANLVADTPGFQRRLGGTGPLLNPLEWDVKTYFAINGAVHDAAIACWGAKRVYDGVRPITMIRYMGKKGQSSDSGQPSYDPEGLPLEPGLIELITAQSSAPGERHAGLVAAGAQLGEVAIVAWPGGPADPKTQYSGTRWVLAKEWVPYQRSTFVTPAFPGYYSGHSTYSRSAAEVLTHLTGSEYFPGGLGEFAVAQNGFLQFEIGPSGPVRLQWARYFDAADQAGQSRLWGGIHVQADDFTGRTRGHEIGIAAFDKAVTYFDGTAVP